MDPFISEIRAFAFSYAPIGWHVCDGSLLSVQQYAALYSLIGTKYGGNGQATFQLPDLRGVIAVGPGQLSGGGGNYDLFAKGGNEQVTISPQTLGAHSHTVNGFTLAVGSETATPAAGSMLSNLGVLATTNKVGFGYGQESNHNADVSLNANTISVGPVGGPLPHGNMAPYLPLTYCIALEGIYPTRP